jgi:(1->4)-alpha-D-glucan 1-alpha-D-glucosylmutase
VPDFAAEYLFYQSAIGIWPHCGQHATAGHSPSEADRDELRERLERYMVKALREAKRHTNWAIPNEEYETAIVAFIRRLIPAEPSLFESELQAFVEQIAFAGYWNALARTMIQFTAPGFPDIYQGDDIWNFALVDPDNRRPVDFTHRDQMLDSLDEELESHDLNQSPLWKRMIADSADGRIKLFLIQAVLRARRERALLFQRGTYVPLEVLGSRKEHCFAYYRCYEEQELIVLVPRMTQSLVQVQNQAPVGSAVWRDTAIVLPENTQALTWISGLTHSTIEAVPISSTSTTLPVGELLAELPVGLYFNVPPEE